MREWILENNLHFITIRLTLLGPQAVSLQRSNLDNAAGNNNKIEEAKFIENHRFRKLAIID